MFCIGDCTTSFYPENCMHVISYKQFQHVIFFPMHPYQVCIFASAAFFSDERTTWLCCWEQGQYLFLPLCERAVWWKWRPQYAVRECCNTRASAAQRKVINHHQDHVTRHKRVGHDSRARDVTPSEASPSPSYGLSTRKKLQRRFLHSTRAASMSVKSKFWISIDTLALTAGKFPVDARTFGTQAVATVSSLDEI
jgi:hypothetical protein